MKTETAVDALNCDFFVVDNKECLTPGLATESYMWNKNIDEKLRPGTKLLLKGTILPGCKRFIVNLMNVQPNRSDIVFHFNPRLAQRYVVRNSFINFYWGEEETTSVGIFKLARNKSFSLEIICTAEEFFVSINSKHFCAFTYRAALDVVNRVQVEGLVKNISMELLTVSCYPELNELNMPFFIPSSANDLDEEANQQLVTPITAIFPDDFKVGWQLEISGQVKLFPSSFYINLQEGQYLWPHPVIPLHLNPRFYTSYGTNIFICNSWANGNWNSEERSPGFHFAPGSIFKVVIRKMAEHFEVLVNDQLLSEYKFRTAVDKIDTVFINGDVKIKRILFKKKIL